MLRLFTGFPNEPSRRLAFSDASAGLGIGDRPASPISRGCHLILLIGSCVQCRPTSATL
jgi:hypothetical protein